MKPEVVSNRDNSEDLSKYWTNFYNFVEKLLVIPQAITPIVDIAFDLISPKQHDGN